MKLCSLKIGRLPGIEPGFELDQLAPDINIIVGPNASGKTSLLRALRASLYAEALRDTSIHVEATFKHEDEELRSTRTGQTIQWTRDGQPAASPLLPDYRFLPCYTLGIEGLLGHQETTDDEIAEDLARDLAGGYDISAVRNSGRLYLKATHGRQEGRDLSDARNTLRKRQQEHQSLRQDETRLQDLHSEREQAEIATREVEAHRRALVLLEARRKRQALETRLKTFPDGMDKLRGDERIQLDRLKSERNQHQSEREREQANYAAAEKSLAESGLDESSIDEAVINDRRQQAQRLKDLESSEEHYRSSLSEAAADLKQSIQDLGGVPDKTVKIDPATLAQVESALNSKRNVEAEHKTLTTEIDRLPTKDIDLNPLRSARKALLDWLSAPRETDRTPQRIVTVLVLVLSGLIGIGAAAFSWHPALGLLVIPLLAGGYMMLRRGPGRAQRQEAQNTFERTGIAAPEPWDIDRVQERLTSLDRELVEGEAHIEGYRRRADAERTRTTLEKDRLEPILESLKSLASQVGFDPLVLDASFERWLRLIHNYDRAKGTYLKTRSHLERIRSEQRETRDDLIEFLRQYNETPETTDADAAQLAGRLERLGDRVRQRNDASAKLETIGQTLKRLNNEINRIDEQVRSIFEQAELTEDDDTTLDQRLAQLDTWKKLQADLNGARITESEREQDLGHRPDLKARVEQEEEDWLRQQRDTYEKQAESSENITEHITRIKADIERAGRERELEVARANHQAAENALHDRLEEALFAHAGHYLLDQVEKEHQQASQPDALRRAAEWFRRFTRHQFELEFDAGQENRFVARETSSHELRQLTELSSGTRMQLRLAVRIAFALEAERGRVPLPLILDEALTTADPERFHAAAESLQLLAEEDNRQIFYLTAQPDDLRYWTRHDADINCIDLAQIRRQGQAITELDSLSLPPRPEITPPEGYSPEQYGIEIGVPPVHPWNEPGNLHLFYLLRDDLAFLYRLISKGIHRAGSAHSFLESDAARHFLSDEEREQLRRRLLAAGTWVEAWRQGRGKPVDRQALETSGAVSDTFIDQVTVLSERLNGDAKTLIEELQNGSIDRFRTDKREQLAQWLEDQGYLDNREPMDESTITLRVASALRTYIDNPEQAYAEAQLLTDSLRSGISKGSELNESVARNVESFNQP